MSHGVVGFVLAVAVLCAGSVADAAPQRARLASAGHLASWYGSPIHEGRAMASGCRFTAQRLSAASRTLPLGAWIRVRNHANGRAVVVRVLDRGPYVRGRALDLSRAAAVQLDMLHDGVARVDIELLRFEPVLRCP